MYHFIIASCAILMVALAYRNHVPPGFWRSAMLGGLAVVAVIFTLAIIGAATP